MVLITDPLNWYALYGLSKSLNQLKKYKEAEGHIKKAIEINPNYPNLFLCLYFVKNGLNQLDDAIYALKKTIGINKNHYLPWQFLGDSLLKKNRLKEAIENFHRSLELNSENSTCWSFLGLAQRLCGFYNDSIKSHLKAIELDKANGVNYFGLAKCYYKTNDFANSLSYIIKSLDISLDYSQLGLFNRIKVKVKQNFVAELYDKVNIIDRQLDNEKILDDLLKSSLQKLEIAKNLNHLSVIKSLNNKIINYIENNLLTESNPLTLTYISSCYRHVGDIKNAEITIDKALNGIDRTGIIYYNKGRILEIIGETENNVAFFIRALNYFKKSQNLNPDYIKYKNALSRIEEHIRKYQGV